MAKRLIDHERISVVPGLALWGLLITGLVGNIFVFQQQDAAGLYASAASFGIITIIAYYK